MSMSKIGIVSLLTSAATAGDLFRLAGFDAEAGFHVEEDDAALGGEGLGGLGVVGDQAFEEAAAGFGVAAVFELPGGDLREPFGDLAFGLVGHVEEQLGLFDA